MHMFYSLSAQKLITILRTRYTRGTHAALTLHTHCTHATHAASHAALHTVHTLYSRHRTESLSRFGERARLALLAASPLPETVRAR